MTRTDRPPHHSSTRWYLSCQHRCTRLGL